MGLTPRSEDLAPPVDVEPADLVVHLVPMRRRHLRSVLRIESQVYPKPWSYGLFASELALRNSRAYYVACVDGTVVGYGGLMVNDEDGHITTLAVDPSWRRLRIASRLLLALSREALGRGATGLTLEVRVGNGAAQGLYRSFGFAPAGVRRNYYAETREDALVMWAEDVDSDEYGQRLARLEAAIPGETVVEDRFGIRPRATSARATGGRRTRNGNGPG